MKKLVALVLAGVMMASLPVMAASSPSAKAVTATVVVDTTSVVEAVAAEQGKTVGEYHNNVIVTVPGLTDVTPVGQGGHVVLNGAKSNVTFVLDKPTATTVKSAKAFAAGLGGKVLNVVNVTSNVVGKFTTAQVNFYVKGLTANQNVKVYQFINGEWVELNMAELREEHTVVDMTQLGALAWVELPTAN